MNVISDRLERPKIILGERLALNLIFSGKALALSAISSVIVLHVASLVFLFSRSDPLDTSSLLPVLEVGYMRLVFQIMLATTFFDAF